MFQLFWYKNYKPYLSDNFIIIPTGALATQGKGGSGLAYDLISEWSVEQFFEIWRNNHTIPHDANQY